MTKCKFCQEECDGKLILRSTEIFMSDDSDITLCNTCMNLYQQEEWDKLTERITQSQNKSH